MYHSGKRKRKRDEKTWSSVINNNDAAATLKMTSSSPNSEVDRNGVGNASGDTTTQTFTQQQSNRGQVDGSDFQEKAKQDVDILRINRRHRMNRRRNSLQEKINKQNESLHQSLPPSSGLDDEQSEGMKRLSSFPGVEELVNAMATNAETKNADWDHYESKRGEIAQSNKSDYQHSLDDRSDLDHQYFVQRTIINHLQDEVMRQKERSQLLRKAKRPTMLKKFESTVPYKKEALESFTSTVRGLISTSETKSLAIDDDDDEDSFDFTNVGCDTSTPTLTREGFHQLVTSLLPEASTTVIDEMFDSLCEQVQMALNMNGGSDSPVVTEVTLEGLSALYDTPAYCLHEHRQNANELLHLLDEEVEKEFAKATVASDANQKEGRNDRHENGDHEENNNKKKNEFISKIISGQLITPTKEQSLIPTELEWITEPAVVSPSKFITELETWTGKHPFMKHSFIRSLAEGCYDNNAALVARLLEAYVACISKSFPSAVFISSLLDDTDIDEIENKAARQDKMDEENERLMSYIGLVTIMMDRVTFLAGRDAVSQISSAEEAGRTLGNVYERLCSSPESTIATMLGAIYFGSEYVSPIFYGQLKRAVKSIDGIGSHYSAVFGLFGVGDHTSAFRRRLLEVVITKSRRMEVIGSAKQILDALEAFVCQVTSTLSSTPTASDMLQTAGELYNDEQSDKWVRSEASCLSDFTGIPDVMEFCKDHVNDTTWILDVGCGEGFPARQFTKQMGARKVVGVDISKEMIAKAERTAKEQGIAIPDEQCFLVGSANKLTDTLHDNFHRVGVLPGADLHQFGCFDMSVAIFLFNYLSTQETFHCIKDVYSLLRPGGVFVFVVPHPLMPYMSTCKAPGVSTEADETRRSISKEGSLQYYTDKFDKTQDGQSHYFSRRDHTITGIIKTKDGKKLNIRAQFKTFGDYITAVKDAGFELVEMKEAHVSKEHWESDQEFFSSVNDQPLHVIFKVRKPAVNLSSRFSPKIVWTALHRSNLEAYIKLPMPDAVKDELRTGANEVYTLTTAVCQLLAKAKGAPEWSSCEASLGAYEWNDLSATRSYAALAKNTLEEFGAVLIQDAEFFPDDSDRSKLCYLILTSLMGPVDDSTRGPLFDVKDYGLDLKAANTLVSVTNADSGWHTDGAAKDKSYKTIGLQCIRPTHGTGGQFMLANAGNCLSSLQVKMPFFLLYELLRPLARDIMEKGKGRGVEESIERQVGSKPTILSKRIRCNAFPVFEQAHLPEGPGKVVKPYVRFRYMREWIESGSRRADLPLSPLLKIALDCLDAELEDQTAFKRCLRRGEIVYSNNHVLAHRRYEFTEDGPAHARRHMVRVWLKEVVDIHNNEDDEY